MKALVRSNPAVRQASFGNPGCVDPSILHKLPEAMQRDGILIMLETGQREQDVANAIGLSTVAMRELLGRKRPFHREDEYKGVSL